jgi:aspartate/methionine/tyrosine aminotransferase
VPLKVSKRGNVPPFIVMDVMRATFEREAAGETVLHMEVGQPGTGAPQGVLESIAITMRDDRMGYTDAFGLMDLRLAIQAHYASTYQVDVPVEQIVVTTGSSGAFILGFLAAFDPGDRVALASPGYPAYRNILTALGIEVVEILVGPETNFQPTTDLIDDVDGNLDGLIIASPSNPTGTMIGAAGLKELYDYCVANQIRMVSDEIYHGITYDEPAETVAKFGADAIIVNSFSKYFSMTGWRLGWMIVPPELVRAIECLAQNLFISPPAISQHAGIAVFDCTDELDRHVVTYAKNRELLLRELPKAGFDKLASADGAFYIYADVSAMTNDSAAFCQRMLAETGVAATPGTDFDPSRGHQFIRFSFARDTADMKAAADKLIAWRSRS